MITVLTKWQTLYEALNKKLVEFETLTGSLEDLYAVISAP
jgi:hypothetical protein